MSARDSTTAFIDRATGLALLGTIDDHLNRYGGDFSDGQRRGLLGLKAHLEVSFK